MGIQTVVVSDWTGLKLPSDTKPVKLTLQAPGVTAKDAQTFELYMSQDEIDQFAKRLERGEPIFVEQAPASKRQTGKSSGNGVSEDKEQAWQTFTKLREQAGVTAIEFAETINAWLADNPVAKQRGGGNYTKVVATKQGIQPPIMDAYAAAQ